MPQEWKDAAFARLAKACVTNFVGYFRPDARQLEEQKQLFMTGQVRNPHFTYPGMKGKPFALKLKRLDNALETGNELTALIDASPIARLYNDSLTRLRNAIRLAQAARARDMAAFAERNSSHGFTPREDIYQSILWSLERRLGSDRTSSYAELLHEILPTSDGMSLLPSQRLIRDLQEPLLELCDRMGLPSRYRHTGYWPPEYFAHQLQQAFDHRGMEGWQAEVTNKQARCSTNDTKRRIFVPATQELPAKRARAVAAHELLHAWRMWQGTATGYYLLYNGTATNPFIEEGVATAVQQGITGAVTNHVGEEAYLGIGLAAGLIDGEPRDFRAVYEILVLYYQLLEAETSLAERSKESPEERAWIRTYRIFRGTDCQTPGAYFGKDLIYAEGNLTIWEMLADHPERIDYFAAGKFNPANDREVNELVRAGIIPAL